MGTNTYSIFISTLFVETYGRNCLVQLTDPKRSLQEDRIELLNQKLPSTHAVRGGGPGGVRPSRYYADLLGLHWLYSSPPACTPFLHASFIVSTSNQLHRVVSYLFFFRSKQHQLQRLLVFRSKSNYNTVQSLISSSSKH